MRLLVDESLSDTVAHLLADAGHDAVTRATSASSVRTTKRSWAADGDDRVLISADTNFGKLLALNRHPGPSVVILRRSPHRPTEQARLLLRALPDLEESLVEGAVVWLTPATARIRRLPIEPTT